MNLAFNLARDQSGLTGPNPPVGCVIVKKNRVISHFPLMSLPSQKNQNMNWFSEHKSEKAIWLEYNGDKNEKN